jgi:filamentous hemagglutinin family protein
MVRGHQSIELLQQIAIACLPTLLLSVALPNRSALAQVTFDGTLGNVLPGQIPTNGNFTYEVLQNQGLTSNDGSNLFHSFSQFNLAPLESINFLADPTVLNVITRVTGGDPSDIAGTITAPANFFLINPSGISFNDNATINVEGAFVSSTSPGLFFNDGSVEFRALNPQSADDALLTIAADVGNFNTVGRVGDIAISNATLQPPDVRLGFDASIIVVNGSRLGGQDGIVIFNADDLAISDSFLVVPNGLIEATASNILINNSGLITDTIGIDPAGGIFFTAEQITVQNNSILGANTLSEGDGGLIFLDGDLILIDQNTQLQASTSGTGRSGVILLGRPGRGAVIFDNTSGALATIENGGFSINGDPDNPNFTDTNFNIFIQSNLVFLNNESQLQTLVREGAGGSAGWIGIIAEDVIISNNSIIFSIVEAEAVAGSIAGAVALDVENNVVFDNNSGITTSILTDGVAGVVVIDARGDVLLSNNSGIISTVEAGVTATTNPNFAGAIAVDAGRLGLTDGSFIETTNRGVGAGGNIDIVADVVAVNDVSFISAEAEDGIAGNLDFRSQFISLSGGSNISTESQVGAGGNMDFDVTNAIFAAPARDSNIRSDAPEGAGGDITFNSSLFLRNIAPREQDLIFSNDITASGSLESGIIGFQSGTQDLNPVQEQVTLPTDLIDASRLIAQGCAAGNLTAAQEIGELIVTGRGGVPPSLSEQVSDAGITPDLVETGNLEAIAPTPAIAQVEQPDIARIAEDVPIYQEAQGWVYGTDGEVILTAAAPTVVPLPVGWIVLGCDDV